LGFGRIGIVFNRGEPIGFIVGIGSVFGDGAVFADCFGFTVIAFKGVEGFAGEGLTGDGVPGHLI